MRSRRSSGMLGMPQAPSTRQLALRYPSRLLLRPVSLLCLSALCVILFMLMRPSASRTYLSAVATMDRKAENCDSALRKGWILGMGAKVIERSMCVQHDEISDVRPMPGDVRFFVIGDWGRDGMCCQRDVAKEMAKAVDIFMPDFIANVGDSFYKDGIETPRDSLIDTSWRDVYLRPHAAMSELKWMSIPGNHDHQGNVGALMALDRNDELWYMPKRYYFETVANGEVLMAFLDTTALYYRTEKDFAKFKGDAVTLFYRDNQVADLRNALSESTARFKLVFAHHPLFSSGKNQLEEGLNLRQMRTLLLALLAEHKVAAYFSGHEHTLEHLESHGVNFFVSGAGSKVSPIHSHLNESRFAMGQQGFLAVALDLNASQLHVQVVSLQGSVPYTVSIDMPLK